MKRKLTNDKLGGTPLPVRGPPDEVDNLQSFLTICDRSDQSLDHQSPLPCLVTYYCHSPHSLGPLESLKPYETHQTWSICAPPLMADQWRSLHCPMYSQRNPGSPTRKTRNPPGILVIPAPAIVHQMVHSWLFFLQWDSW
jgi:hypothetical protein